MKSRPAKRLAMMAFAASALICLRNLPADEAVRVIVEPSQKVVIEKPGTTVHVNVTVEGAATASAVVPQRLPLNLVMVLDRSGSMNADNKWGYVRKAVEDALELLGPNDYVTLVTYSSGVQTVIPTTRNVDLAWARSKIAQLSPEGSTNLHGGLSEGTRLLTEHLDSKHLSRVLLLSDGIANVGPSSTQELRAFAETASGKGIRISTLGVGADYNEDLMLGVAKDSGGSYYFIDQPSKVASIFQEELSGLINVVARELQVTITLPPGVSFVSSLDREAELRRVTSDDNATVLALTMPELAAGQKRQIHLELRLDTPTAAAADALAKVEVSYAQADAAATRNVTRGQGSVSLSQDETACAASLNAEVELRVVRLQSAQNREQAMKLMDAGRTDEAQQLMLTNRANLGARANAFAASPAPGAAAAASALKDEESRVAGEAAAYTEGDATARKVQQFNIYNDKK